MTADRSRAVPRVDGSGPATPPQTTLAEGWNFVRAPERTPAETAFGHATGPVGSLLSVQAQPAGTLGGPDELRGRYEFTDAPGAGPVVSPLTGYWVFAEEPATLPGFLSDRPTMSDLYESLRVPDPVERGGGGKKPIEGRALLESLAVEEARDAARRLDNETAVRHATARVLQRYVRYADLDVSRSELRGIVADAVATARNATDASDGGPAALGPSLAAGARDGSPAAAG